MKRHLKSKLVFILIALLAVFGSCQPGEEHGEHEDVYTCPMHPTVTADRPGTCPICGMDLVRKARPGQRVEITEELARLIQSPNEVVIESVATIQGQYESLPVLVEAQGVVTYDTRNIYTISSRVEGRLENVYLKYSLQQVRKGQRIADVYSPELITAQRELLFLLENDPDNKQLIEAAKNKLLLLGLPAARINDLMQKGETSATFPLYSPYSGYVITGQEAPASVSIPSPTASAGGGSMRDGMSTTGSKPSSPAKKSTSATTPLPREGDYVAAGETLFRIADTNALRIELNLPGKYSTSIEKGDMVELDLGDGRKEQTRVDFVQPFFTEGQEFVKVRVYTKKTPLLIGQLVSASVRLSAQAEALWVPRESVLDLGTDKVVFVKERGVLKPRKVSTGRATKGLVEIISGLASSDEIAANAQFLVDSESFIKLRN
jgi:Cu(I)/Ag(I) efflux system membrane fusion protein